MKQYFYLFLLFIAGIIILATVALLAGMVAALISKAFMWGFNFTGLW